MLHCNWLGRAHTSTCTSSMQGEARPAGGSVAAAEGAGGAAAACGWGAGPRHAQRLRLGLLHLLVRPTCGQTGMPRSSQPSGSLRGWRHSLPFRSDPSHVESRTVSELLRARAVPCAVNTSIKPCTRCATEMSRMPCRLDSITHPSCDNIHGRSLGVTLQQVASSVCSAAGCLDRRRRWPGRGSCGGDRARPGLLQPLRGADLPMAGLFGQPGVSRLHSGTA